MVQHRVAPNAVERLVRKRQRFTVRDHEPDRDTIRRSAFRRLGSVGSVDANADASAPVWQVCRSLFTRTHKFGEVVAISPAS